MARVLEVDQCAVQRSGGAVIRLPSLTLAGGETAILYGPSGCGKSTLLLALFDLLPAGTTRTGRVAVFGRDIAALDATARSALLRGQVAWMLQDAQGALDPFQPIGDQIRQATWRSHGDGATTLQALGIDDAEALATRLPHEISGGQAQRVLFAVASLREPELVVADEPTANLDDASCQRVGERLRALRDRGAALLVATHDARLIDALGGTVLVASAGVFAPGAVMARPWPHTPGAPDVGATPVLRARDLRVRLGQREVLAGVDFDLHRGEIVALLGDSGAGKTTLARVLAGQLRPDRGSIERPPRPTAVQLVPQDVAASLTPGRTLRSLLAEAHAPFFEVTAAAASVSLPLPALDRRVEQLSGGEQRRAALLRALAVHPDVLVLDEPTASLDHATAAAIVGTLQQLRVQRGLSLVLVTHDGELARAVADRVLQLSGGRV